MVGRFALPGSAVGLVALLAIAAPALASGNDSSNGTPLSLSIQQESGGQYTFTVSKFNGGATHVDFYRVIDASLDADKRGGGALIGSCAPGDKNGTTVQDQVLTCTFTPGAAFSTTGTLQVVAAEYRNANRGRGDGENNEVKEESNAVTISDGIPQNNLPEVPYAVVLPALGLAAVWLVARGRRVRAG